MGESTLLDETLVAWRDVREGLVDEFRNIPARQWDFRPTPEMRSVRDLAHHILEVAFLVVAELARPDTDLLRRPWPKLLAPHTRAARRATTKQELVRLLRSQLDDAERRFRAAGELSLLQWITYFDGSRGTKFTWLQHGIAQEMYHRGQLTVYARLLGLEPALTKRIRGG